MTNREIYDQINEAYATKVYYTTDGSTPNENSAMWPNPTGHEEFMQKCMENAYQAMLDCRHDSIPQVDALLLAGWSFEIPGIHDEPWQWQWRSPPKRQGSKGRRYLSTSQAFNALKRMTP